MASSEKRCLYEVLGVSRDCAADEIRSAYKKLALQRHPDKLIKSGLSEAEATAQFQELVNAYEVLSDQRERAWYDSHRSQILFSSSSGGSAGNSSNSVYVPDLFSYFSNSVYSGYTDSGKGFFKVYADVFDKVYQSELNFSKKLGLGLPKEAPLMGNMQSPYAQVTAFYNYWLGFATVMDFCWVDQYDVMAGPNRKSRRVMEEENKKLRKKARREYNETVRGLAEFVKKRDKRVIDMQRKREEEREKKREEERERKKELERQKAERARMYEEPDWAKVEEFEDEDIEEEVEEKGKKGDVNEFYCVACGKKFKSDKQWKNHEQSKKHKEKVAELSEAFDDEDGEYEDELVNGGKDEGEDAVEEESAFLSADDGEDELAEHFENRAEIQEDGEEAQSSDEDMPGGNSNGNVFQELRTEMKSDEDEASILETMVSGHNSRKNLGLKQKPNSAAKKAEVEADSDEMDFMVYNNLKGTRRKRGSRRQRARNPEETMEDDVSETNGNADDANISDNSPQVEEASPVLPENGTNGVAVDCSGKKNKLPKPSVKKKGATKQENNVKSKEAAKGRKKKGSSRVSSTACDQCGEDFESKNRLHKHLAESGHATLKSR